MLRLADPGGRTSRAVASLGIIDYCPPVHVRRNLIKAAEAVTDNDQSDAHAIQADSLGVDGKIYRRWSWEQRATPLESIRQAIKKAVELGAEHVGWSPCPRLHQAAAPWNRDGGPV